MVHTATITCYHQTPACVGGQAIVPAVATPTASTCNTRSRASAARTSWPPLLRPPPAPALLAGPTRWPGRRGRRCGRRRCDLLRLQWFLATAALMPTAGARRSRGFLPPRRTVSPPPPLFLAIPLDSPCAGPDQIRSSIIVITGRDWSDLAGRRPRFRPREPPTQSRRPGGCHQAACLRPLARPYAVLHPCTPLRPPLPRSSTTPSSPRGEVSGGTVLPVIPPRLSPPPLQVGPARSARGSVPARPPNQAWCLCR